MNVHVQTIKVLPDNNASWFDIRREPPTPFFTDLIRMSKQQVDQILNFYLHY